MIIFEFNLLASWDVGGSVSYLFLANACTLYNSLDFHNLPGGLGCFADGQHVMRTSRVCRHCGGVADAHGIHMNLKCLALHKLRKQYAAFLSTNTNTMRSFAQQDHMHGKIKAAQQSCAALIFPDLTFAFFYM